eukprot:Em0057g16a
MPEKYDLLEAALDPVLSEIKELMALKVVQVGGKSYELEFYLGGDLKANSKYSCIWCLVPSSDRWDTSKLHPSRSIEDIEACAATNEYSVKYPPLLSIDLDHVVPDELHLFLRIMDILIENLISYAVELDIRATRKQTDLLQGATLKKVQASIQSCGVSFQIWKKKEKPGELDWTSLGGAQKRKVLSLLPAQFPNILPPETCQRVAQLWKDFEETYSAISSWTPDSMVIETKVLRN